MSTDLRDRYALKRHQVDNFRKSDLKQYHNKLTIDKHNTMQRWNMVEYPELGAGNTTVHAGQTYLCMIDGSIYCHLDYQNNKHKSAFLAGATLMTEYTPRGFHGMCMIMEKAGAINRIWIHPFLCRRRGNEGIWGFVCADQNDNADAHLPIKYQPKVDGWGVQIMAYLRKVLPKEAKGLLDLCGADGHQALQQLHLRFNPIHFRYQTDQCKNAPVEENDTIEEYTKKYQWYQLNKALVLNEKFDIGDELTQDLFISNMKRSNEVRSIVSVKRKSTDQYIANRYHKESFFNSIIALYNGLEPTSGGQARSFRGRSQTNVHSVTHYNNNNNYDDYDDWNGPEEYEYCRPGVDPDFASYESLMRLAYSDCDVNSLAYGDKHDEKIFKGAVMAISSNLHRAFDTSRPCALCGKTGHSFDNCEELKDPAAIRKAYISLRIALQKLKGLAATQTRDINTIRAYKISYVNSMDSNPPSPVPNSGLTNRMDKMDVMMVSMIKCIHSLGKHSDRTADDDDDDHDEDSQSSLNRKNMSDIYRGAHK